MRKASTRKRFIVPLLALVLSFALAPVAFAGVTAGTMSDGEDVDIQPFGPGAALENAEVVVDTSKAIVYTGKELKPAITVWLDTDEDGVKDLLTKGTDYEVFYKENVAAGTGWAYAWCQDSEHMYHTGASFKIAAAPISKTTIKIARQVYTGKKLTPVPSIKYNGMTLKKGTDYTITYKKNKKVGTAKAIIKGKGNYTGKVTKTFKIARATLANAKVRSVKAKTYTGSRITPQVIVKFKGQKLKLNRDYTVKYKKNTNVGIAKIVVRGKNNFRGKRVLEFTINPASISKCKVSYSSSVYWNGSQIKPTPTVTYKGKTLKAGTDYLVRYSNNDVVGTATMIISGKGNFTGTEKYSFEIKSLPLTDSSIKVTPADGTQYNYTGNGIVPSVTVRISANGKNYIVSSSYYDVFYSSDGTNYVAASEVNADNFKGAQNKNVTYRIRIQAKQGKTIFTGYRTIKYTVLKQAANS